MDFNDGDYGYGLGLAAYMGGAVLLGIGWWLPAVALIAAAFALCWWYG